MCLIIVSTAQTALAFSDEHLEDFLQYNPDGAGFMWFEDGRVDFCKIMPSRRDDGPTFDGYAYVKPEYEQEFKQTWRLVAERCRDLGSPFACHLRMRTHGDINEENCHPYPLDDGLLMHNGVLSHGNDADKTKSDTWHYARKLERLAYRFPGILADEQFQDFVASDISDSNRFVLALPGQSEFVILNRHTGVEFTPAGADTPAWMSNTYAWSAHAYLPRAYLPAKWTNTTREFSWGIGESSWDETKASGNDYPLIGSYEAELAELTAELEEEPMLGVQYLEDLAGEPEVDMWLEAPNLIVEIKQTPEFFAELILMYQ